MPKSKPGYYEKKYFDTQFGFVVGKIEDVENEIKRINGSIETVTRRMTKAEKYLPTYNRTVKKVRTVEKKVNGIEKRYIYVSGVATGAGTLIGYLMSTILK